MCHFPNKITPRILLMKIKFCENFAYLYFSLPWEAYNCKIQKAFTLDSKIPGKNFP